MTTLVTGSAGHLGEALMRRFHERGHHARGIDLKASPFTDATGNVADAEFVAAQMCGVEVVMHTATLHKPHVATHTQQDFIDANVSGTRVLLEAAVAAGAKAFIFTSTTSTFGRAMQPQPGDPAVWVTEGLAPVPKNIYGVTKVAAEGLCELAQLERGLPCIVLRTSRFFPEEDDRREIRDDYSDLNAKVNEYTHRRVELRDVVSAHERAAARAAEIGFGRYIVSATTPFTRSDAPRLGRDAGAVMEARVPGCAAHYAALGWRMPPAIGRVYDNAAARRDLDWAPAYDFEAVLRLAASGQPAGSALARAVGKKGYHDEVFEDGPFPVR